jgi:RHS repeat-associated protein
LKTASVETDASGNIKDESDFYPWGGELQFLANDSNHYKYGGHERDGETGLDYQGARYYSNGLGRFITPDWSATPVAVPYADLNQYAYVHNNPMTFGDPDGHDGVGAVLEKTVEYVEDGLAKLVDGAEGALAEAGGGASVAGSSRWGLLAGVGVYVGAMLHPQSVGQSNADEIAERDRLDAENAQSWAKAEALVRSRARAMTPGTKRERTVGLLRAKISALLRRERSMQETGINARIVAVM